MPSTLRAYKNKVTNKLFGVVTMPALSPRKGFALVSFITGPFTKAPGEFFTDPHSNYWVVEEIVRLLNKRGFDVDIINWNDNKFTPRKKYDLCIDMQYNLERLSKYLPPECIKVMHLVASHPKFQNKAEITRIKALEKRREVLFAPKRTEPMTSNPKIADFIVGYGNKTVHGTFGEMAKKIIPFPVPIMERYDFPDYKDFSKVRKNFLWFGGGGAILKGLDLVVEAFAELPHLKLTLIGTSAYEKEFEKMYEKELSLPNIERHWRPHLTKEGKNLVEKRDVKEILDECGAIVFLSASEGGGGATVQAMGAGLVPIVTKNSGINEKVQSIIVEDLSIQNIKKIVEEFSNLPGKTIKEMAYQAWKFANENHTKEAFTKKYEDFLDNVLKLK